MFRPTNSPILRSTFWLYIQLLVQCTDTAADRCIVPKGVYTVKKCSWGWENLSAETCRADLKRLINETVVAPCWLLTSSFHSIFMASCKLQHVEFSPTYFETLKKYRVIHKSLRDFRPLRYISRDGHAEGERVNRGRDTPIFCPTLQVLDMWRGRCQSCNQFPTTHVHTRCTCVHVCGSTVAVINTAWQYSFCHKYCMAVQLLS